MAEHADKFNGEAEYETLRNIVKAVDIPVIANGDIDSAEKAARVLDSSSAHGVMIGRAAQGQLGFPDRSLKFCAMVSITVHVRKHALNLPENTVGYFTTFMAQSWASKSRGSMLAGFEAELGDSYLFFKRAFNALTSQDAQEQFFYDESSSILTRSKYMKHTILTAI